MNTNFNTFILAHYQFTVQCFCSFKLLSLLVGNRKVIWGILKQIRSKTFSFFFWLLWKNSHWEIDILWLRTLSVVLQIQPQTWSCIPQIYFDGKYFVMLMKVPGDELVCQMSVDEKCWKDGGQLQLRHRPASGERDGLVKLWAFWSDRGESQKPSCPYLHRGGSIMQTRTSKTSNYWPLVCQWLHLANKRRSSHWQWPQRWMKKTVCVLQLRIDGWMDGWSEYPVWTSGYILLNLNFHHLYCSFLFILKHATAIWSIWWPLLQYLHVQLLKGWYLVETAPCWKWGPANIKKNNNKYLQGHA